MTIFHRGEEREKGGCNQSMGHFCNRFTSATLCPSEAPALLGLTRRETGGDEIGLIIGGGGRVRVEVEGV